MSYEAMDEAMRLAKQQSKALREVLREDASISEIDRLRVENADLKAVLDDVRQETLAGLIKEMEFHASNVATTEEAEAEIRLLIAHFRAQMENVE